jgi:hypothetical protein
MSQFLGEMVRKGLQLLLRITTLSNGQFRRSGGRDQHLGGHAWEAGPSIRCTKLAELLQNAVAGQRAGHFRSAQTNSPLEPAPRFGATSRTDHGPQESTPILRP